MKTNPELKNLIRELKRLSKKENVNIWNAIAKQLEKSTRRRPAVNLQRINKYGKDNETIIIPGKVLSSGNLDKKVTVAALQFSEKAEEKIKNHLTIQELMKKNPKGSKIRIIR